jgi:hypothetical protein
MKLQQNNLRFKKLTKAQGFIDFIYYNQFQYRFSNKRSIKIAFFGKVFKSIDAKQYLIIIFNRIFLIKFKHVRIIVIKYLLLKIN